MLMSPKLLNDPFFYFKHISNISRDGLSTEGRVGRTGGTAMPLSSACYEARISTRENVQQDEFLGAIKGKQVTISYKLQPWTNLLEEIDFQENTRAHALAFWDLSLNETIRQAIKADHFMKTKFYAELLTIEDDLREIYRTYYLELAATIFDYASFDDESFIKWMSKRKVSSTGGAGTWGGILKSKTKFETAVKEMKNFILKFWLALPGKIDQILDHNYAWDPEIVFPALRNRPDQTTIQRDSGTLVLDKYRDRGAGGERGLSWLLAVFEKEDLRKWEIAAMSKALKGHLTHLSSFDSPLKSGLDAYIKAMDSCPYMYDVSNCERFVGGIGFSIGRVYLKHMPVLNPLAYHKGYSGHFSTTPDNKLFVLKLVDFIHELSGTKGGNIINHGDNVATDTPIPCDFMPGLDQIIRQENTFLGHDTTRKRAIGLKLMKDRAELRFRWRRGQKFLRLVNKKPEATELTQAMLVRDTIKKIGGPTYISVLREIASKTSIGQQAEVIPHFFQVHEHVKEFKGIKLMKNAEMIVVEKYDQLIK